jgi:hypothetical protein
MPEAVEKLFSSLPRNTDYLEALSSRGYNTFVCPISCVLAGRRLKQQ